MVLVVGLGNPGKKYVGNRHNVGFMVAEKLLSEQSLPDPRDKFSGAFSKGAAFGGDVAVLMPHTFMNLSGDSVQPACAFLKIEPKDVVVVHDELDLPFGEVRLKVGGGHAGHNGLRSIIQRLGSQEFARVRVGIGRPPPGFRGEVADFVLSPFDALERAELADVLKRATEIVLDVLARGVAPAMNTHNKKLQGAKAPAKRAAPPRSGD